VDKINFICLAKTEGHVSISVLGQQIKVGERLKINYIIASLYTKPNNTEDITKAPFGNNFPVCSARFSVLMPALQASYFWTIPKGSFGDRICSQSHQKLRLKVNEVLTATSATKVCLRLLSVCT